MSGEYPAVRSRPYDAAQAQRWADKAMKLAVPLVELAGDIGDPGPVRTREAPLVEEWPYGGFMVTWLEQDADPKCIHHVPDGGFFLDVIALALAPVFEKHPELRRALEGESRTELSITNDVLQIQLRGLTENTGYSMIRNHALMHLYGTLWLDEPARSDWLAIFDAALTHLDERPGGRTEPSLLAQIEEDGFRQSVELASRSLDDDEARRLLAHPDEMRAFLEYQLHACAAIGLLWRHYRELSTAELPEWERRQFAEGYASPNFLLSEWRSQP